MERLVKIGRLPREELDGPEMPLALEYLWQWFNELIRARRVGAWGVHPLTYADIDAWARLTDRRPKPYEVKGLLLLDAEMRNPTDPEED